jgi:predicted transposase YbfD/YdcC
MDSTSGVAILEAALDQFVACFEDLKDPRTGNAGLHGLHELLFIALCTVLSGGQGATDMARFAAAKEPFLRAFLKLENGLPSHDTFSRLFRLLDPEQFRAVFQRFMARFSETVQGVIAIDGKVLRRSFDRASNKSALHMVSAWGCDQRMVLAQIATEAKSNEITAVPKLLEMLCLKGTIVTVDALNCQREIAQKIVGQGGDYALALKGNQGTLHDDGVTYLNDPASKTITAKPVVDGDHGRIETRTATVSTNIEWLQDNHQWPGLAAIAKVHRTREIKGKTTSETAYYLLSADLSPERCNEAVRSHWGVENRLHWRLDVTMNEDQDRTRLGNAPHNLAVLRRMALNVMQKDKSKNSLRGKFICAGWDDKYMARLMALFLKCDCPAYNPNPSSKARVRFGLRGRAAINARRSAG